MRTYSFVLLLVVGLMTVGFAQQGGGRKGGGSGSRGDATDADQERLRAAGLPTDDAGLVNFFRLRAQGRPFPGTLEQLVEKLYAPTPAARQQAAAELIAIGTPVLPLLRSVARNTDPTAATLARQCLKAIETDGGTLTTAAANVLAQRRAPGAVNVLLTYVPFVESDKVRDDLQEVVNALTYDAKGNTHPTVVKALSDSHPMRRVAAVTALVHGNWVAHRQALRKLLRDPSPSVRWRASLPLAQRDDAEAVSTMIAMLGDLGEPQGREAIGAFLTDLAGELGPKVALGNDEAGRRKAGEAWAQWWQGLKDDTLLAEMKKRTVSDEERAKLGQLVEKLGDKAFIVRKKTEDELIRLGQPVLALLRLEAQKKLDIEVLQRLHRCIDVIGQSSAKETSILGTIARLLAVRKPAGAAEAILAYLPCTDDNALLDQLQKSLNSVAVINGQPQPAVLKALTDKAAVRRGAAAWALCGGVRPALSDSDPAVRQNVTAAVRPLLNDPEVPVRVKAALGLTAVRDADAVPTLIKLLAEPLPADLAQQAEGYLGDLAQESQPKDLPAGEGKEARTQRSAMWSKWWQANRDKIALVDPFDSGQRPTGFSGRGRFRGYTLLVLRQAGTVTELDANGKTRWTLTDLANPSDALVLSEGRVLVTEQDRVTERDLRGKILWQYDIPMAFTAQRLPNGNTFIACKDRLIEVNRAGKEVFNMAIPQINTARKLPDGRMVIFHENNDYVMLDPKGKEIKNAGRLNAGGAGCNEILDNGHSLISSPGMGSLIEFNLDGQVVKQFDMSGVVHGFLLPNGHILVTINGNSYIELDAKWQPIRETPLAVNAFRVKRR